MGDLRFCRSGTAEVADDAGGLLGGGKGGAGLGAAEAEDEAVHLFEEPADFRKLGAEGLSEGAAPGNGGGGIGGDVLELGEFLAEQGGVRGGQGVFGETGETGGIFGEGGGELAVEEVGLGDEFGIAEALPSTEGKADLGGVALASVLVIPFGESLADLVGEIFDLLFLELLVFGEAGGGGLLLGDDSGDGRD